MSHAMTYDEDEAGYRDHPRECLPEEYWKRLAIDIFKVALTAAVGVLVRELVSTIERRHPRTLDPYEV